MALRVWHSRELRRAVCVDYKFLCWRNLLSSTIFLLCSFKSTLDKLASFLNCGVIFWRAEIIRRVGVLEFPILLYIVKFICHFQIRPKSRNMLDSTGTKSWFQLNFVENTISLTKLEALSKTLDRRALMWNQDRQQYLINICFEVGLSHD